MAQDDPIPADEVNRLYWETDRPVSRLAKELGVTRRTVYDTLRPQPTGVPCPECGEELVYRHRSARDAGEADCPGCGLEGEPIRDAPGTAPRSAGSGMGTAGEIDDSHVAYEAPGTAASMPIDAEAALRRSRALLIAGAGVIGALVGATFVTMLRRG